MSFINIPNSSASLNYADVITALGYVPVNLAGDSMLGYLILNADPIVPLGAATKQYVDSVAQGLAIKGAAKVATTGNLVSLSGLLTVDTVTLVAGDRVLVKNQLTPSQNGIYVASSGAWVRSDDMNTGAEAESAFVFVTSGSANQSTGWVQITPAPITLGVTGLIFSQFSGAGTYTADGLGIILSGNQFQLKLDGTTLSKSSLGLKVATGGITNNEISGTAAIAYSKLALSNSIVNADINSAAAIAYSKLNLSNSIINSDINSSAAISRTKIASGSPNQVVVNDGSGVLSSVATLPNSNTSGTSSNTPNTLVLRDGSGNFSSNIITTTSLEINGTSGSGFVQLDVQSAAPSAPPSQDIRIYTDQSNGVTRLRDIDSGGAIFTLHRDGFFIVYNQTGSTINKGQAVYVNGVYTGGSSNAPTIALAKSNSTTTAPSIGLAFENIANNSFGRVMTMGVLSGFDTSAFTNGQAVYLSSTVAGSFTSTEPLAPNISQLMGYIVNSSVSGSIDLSIRSALNTSSGSYRSSFQVGPASGTSTVNIAFANSNVGTLGWNPSSSFPINLPTSQGSAGQYLYGDGSGNLNWINPLSNIDGGSPSSNYVSGQVIIGGTP